MTEQEIEALASEILVALAEADEQEWDGTVKFPIVKEILMRACQALQE